MSLDTLAIARELRGADVAPAQAEAIASAIGRSVSEGAATKADIEKPVERIESLRVEIKADRRADTEMLLGKLEGVRSSVLTWMVGVILAASGVIIAIFML